ncbi:EGF-like domain-containing protein [Caenorhabditis elegans]|uniref:EGF-like domain-containing protein n=1 Tax=Caenorhabditis elegans TaxID=6239 RepID=Q94229_CAEEL|nr:EGF-like domain-containing protein [Caenorhabditis elegans]CCD63790.2 EGF-like domain-containing protein [Caenorhabditis elegans]|eukprot:NP_501240.4 Uncharacterized protein CELE_F45E4.6 [Caenorhabditis elegans]
MKLTRKFTIHLQLFIYANLVNCFSIDSPEKIALEPNTLIVRDTQEYWALGWPTSISCDSKSKLEDINSGEGQKMYWKIRYPDSKGEETLDQDDKANYDYMNNLLQIKNVSRNFNNTVFECVIERPGNITMISRHRVQIQDCIFRSPPDTTAYNLHNPCAYGKCMVEWGRVECLCFRQYGGIHCDGPKWGNWYLNLFPFVLASFVIGLFIIFFCITCIYQDDRKQEKLMEISQVVGHSDRIDFTLYDLYPFVGKLGGCIYTEADAVDDKKYERVRKTITDFLQRGEDEEKDEQIGVTTVGTTMEIPPKTTTRTTTTTAKTTTKASKSSKTVGTTKRASGMTTVGM